MVSEQYTLILHVCSTLSQFLSLKSYNVKLQTMFCGGIKIFCLHFEWKPLYSFFLLCLSTDIEPVSGIIDEACSIRSRGGDHMKYV